MELGGLTQKFEVDAACLRIVGERDVLMANLNDARREPLEIAEAFVERITVAAEVVGEAHPGRERVEEGLLATVSSSPTQSA